MYNAELDINELKRFIKPIEFSEFKRKEMLNSHYFKSSLTNYIRFYFVDSNDRFSEDHYHKEQKFISQNLKGKLREYALTNLAYKYSQKLLPSNISNLISNNQFTNVAYKKEIDKIEKRLKKLKKTVPDSVLNSELLSLDDDYLTLEKVLNKNQNIKIIDFWASWCKPCIKEITLSYDFRKRLTKEYGVQWIYISIDKDTLEWKEKSKELKDLGLLKNQFLIQQAKESLITSFFKNEYIPQYVIFNEKNCLMLDDAPKPSDSLLFKKIIKQIDVYN